MSNFVRKHLKPSFINYESLEVACHSLDSYCDRLIESDIEKLKVITLKLISVSFIKNYSTGPLLPSYSGDDFSESKSFNSSSRTSKR